MQIRESAPELPDWLSRQLPFSRYRIRVDPPWAASDKGDPPWAASDKTTDCNLHVMERGEGRPVLLLHGNPSWGFLYRKVARALEGTKLRLIMPDLVGLGLSDKPRDAGVHTIENHARWIGALIDALGLDDFIFVGQDWGGPIGLRALADRSDRVGGLVILNTVVGPPREDFRPTTFHRFARLPLVSDAVFRWGGFPQNVMGFAQGHRASISGEVARAYRWPLRALRDRTAPLALARMVPDSMSHPSIAPLRVCQAFVEKFEGPAAIVWGDRDPVLGRVRTWIEKLLPKAATVRTEAGHFLQEEVPEAIAAGIRQVAHP